MKLNENGKLSSNPMPIDNNNYLQPHKSSKVIPQMVKNHSFKSLNIDQDDEQPKKKKKSRSGSCVSLKGGPKNQDMAYLLKL